MADSIERGFSIDVLSLKDLTGIFSGDNAPSLIPQDAPIGSLYLRTNGEMWSKHGALNTEWSRIETTSALNNTFILGDVSTGNNINITGGFLINFGSGSNQGTEDIASYDSGTSITTINKAGAYNININCNAELKRNKSVELYLEIYVDDVSVGIYTNSATGSSSGDILTFLYDGVRTFTTGQELKLYSFRNGLIGNTRPVADQFNITLEFLG